MTVTISSQAKDRLLGKISREFGDDKRKKIIVGLLYTAQ